MKKNKIELKLYLIIIFSCLLITAFIVSLSLKKSFLYFLLVMFIGIIIVIIIDAVSATLCRLLPLKYADFEKHIYHVSKKEKHFYEKIKIRKWKEKIPEIGHFTGFRKNRIAKPNDINYIKRFLHEICYGQIGHFISIFTGFFLLLFSFINEDYLVISLVIIIVNAFLNILPIMVLRYNSYTLIRLYQRLIK